MRRLIALLPVALLATCGSKSNVGSSPEEQRELNEAAAALDADDSSPTGQPGTAAIVNASPQPYDQGNAQ